LVVRRFHLQFDDFTCRDLLDAGRVGCRHGWGALNLGLQAIARTARIVIDLRRPCRAKHESGSILQNTPDLCVERFSASHLVLRLEKRTVCGVELSYHGRASCGIHLPEAFEQIPFHQIGKRFARL
jgi:hypothetical protein